MSSIGNAVRGPLQTRPGAAVGVNLAIHDRQEGRVILRFSMAALVGMLSLAVVGCGESAGPASLAYSPNEDVATKLEGKPKVQAQVAKLITDLFGPAPDRMRVPPEAPLPEGGARLASRVVVGAEPNAPSKAVIYRTVDADGSSTDHRIRGGYAIYREQCMHCHGASGDGNGPTGPFLWPPPRDYRLGVFKFTSTSGSGPDSKPTRDDLRRTVRLGIAETSMPAFESLLTPNEIEQVIDYVVFLSMRGEIENGLIYLGQDIEDSAAETDLAPEQAQEAVNLVFERWKAADANVLDPKVPRTPSSRESILRGRRLFLGEKGLQCYGCHGLDATGNGESFVDYRSFVKAVFDGNPSREKINALKEYAEKANKKWGDDWGDPLRPGNLTRGQYKGGRRPLDIYWRIAKGINGTPMPVHLGSQLTSDEEVWDLVNFVLAIPYDSELLKNAQPVPGATLTTSTGTAETAPVLSLSRSAKAH